MQRLKRAIKKMAAIGTGVAMLGATMTGAMAQDLADYPAPFVDSSGIFDESTAIIVGDAAASADTLGAIDIATNLQFMAKTPVSSGAGTVSVAGGVTEDIPIGHGIANSTTIGLDWSLDDSDIDSFMDTTVQFQGKDYDVHDELAFIKQSPSLETSLTSPNDDYEDNIFMEAKKKSIYYMLLSDDSSLNVSKATPSEPFEVKFLGKTLKITEVPDDKEDRFTAYVGTEYFMDVGDVVTVEGKKVTLVNVGIGGAIIVDVDGTIDTITASATKTVNGIEIASDETFYSSTKSERAASLIIGKDAEATYQNNDPFIGEDENSPNWKWTIGNLATKGDTILDSTAAKLGVINVTVTSGPYIGVYNNFRKTSANDNPAGVGECYDLPNNYASICFDSLTVADDEYFTLTVEYVKDAALDETGLTGVSASTPAIYIHASGDNRFKIPADWLPQGNFTLNNATRKTSEIWLTNLGLSATDNVTSMFIRDKDNTPDIRFIGNITGSQALGSATGFAQINFKDTKDNNINLTLKNESRDTYQVVLEVNGDSTAELPAHFDNIKINFTVGDKVNFDRMGANDAEQEAEELLWGLANKTIGNKDENHRTYYGIIIKDPKSNGAIDQAVFEIPADHIQGNIVVKGQAATVSGGSTSFIPADITIDTKLSSEVAGAETAHQLILVGGPCANPTVEAVSSLGKTCSGWDLGAGEAVLKMASNGNKIALLIAGTNAVDTRMAAKVIANYEDYDLSGSSVVVTGSMSSPVLKVA